MNYYEQIKDHPGQRNMNTGLGYAIYNMIYENNFNIILDIGTWNGNGTTLCALKALKKSFNNNCKLYTVELYKEMFDIAKENLKEYLSYNNFIMLNGRIIEPEEIYWFDHSTVDLKNDRHAQLWFEEDIKRLQDSQSIKHLIPENIDFLIMDGGEYTTYPEWNYLKDKIKFFALDDTNTLKCSKIRQEILNSDKYQVLEDNLIDGYLIGKRV